MSWQAIAWGQKQLKAIDGISTKLLFLQMCSYANDRHESSFQIKWMCEVLGMSRTTVKASLGKLMAMKLIARTQRGNQYGTSVYSINVGLDFVDVGSDSVSVGSNSVDEGSEIDTPLNKDTLKDTNKDTIKEELPPWVESLLRDNRLKREDCTPNWIASIESSFADVNLVLEAEACVDWLQQRGRNRKSVKSTFLNWLKRSQADGKSNDFNPHAGGNLDEILKFADTQEVQ